MDPLQKMSLKQTSLLFISIFSIVMVFALVTDHRWEDWYITFRASKNLAEGNGLVYTVGERVHTFTSPLGTLVPALISYLTKNDETTIWLYRIVSALLIGYTGVLLIRFFEKIKINKVIALLSILLYSTHILIVDFSINGMETAFMMLFLTLFIKNLLLTDKNSIKGSIVALTGLMYTRPDSVIYAGVMMISVMLFSKKDEIFLFIKRQTLIVSASIVFYMPWLIWTYWYYGSFIPHTITAKGNLIDYSVSNILLEFVKFPFECVMNGQSLSSLFMPPYFYCGGWYKLHAISWLVGMVTSFVFLVPRLDKRLRILSLGVFLIHFYLSKISGQGGLPWYMPNVALPTIIILALLSDYIINQVKTPLGRWVFRGYLLLVIINILIFCLAAYEFRVQQQVTEFGNRKKIGLWLKENSDSSKDQVFMECLGYIGFYSNLKTYDYPGMSSPEVVSVRKKYRTSDWSIIIEELQPTWVVLRPEEEQNILSSKKFQDLYTKVKVFDVRSQIPSSPFLFGKEILYYDAYFSVYQLKGR